MKDIFHDLYAKVLSFFTQSEENDPTKGVAMNRLKTVLMQDRVGFSERAIQMMKEELVVVVSKYMEIDEDNFALQIDAVENKTVLDLSIPVIRPKTDKEIDEVIKEQDLKNQKKAEEIAKELEKLVKEKAMDLVGEEVDGDLIEQAQKNLEEKEAEELKEELEEEVEEASEEINDEAEEGNDNEDEDENDEDEGENTADSNVKVKKKKKK